MKSLDEFYRRAEQERIERQNRQRLEEQRRFEEIERQRQFMIKDQLLYERLHSISVSTSNAAGGSVSISVPTNLAITEDGSTLSWASNENNFEIWVSVDSAPYYLSGTTTSKSYNLNSSVEGNIYNYKVRAYQGSKHSEFTDSVNFNWNLYWINRKGGICFRINSEESTDVAEIFNNYGYSVAFNISGPASLNESVIQSLRDKIILNQEIGYRDENNPLTLQLYDSSLLTYFQNLDKDSSVWDTVNNIPLYDEYGNPLTAIQDVMIKGGYTYLGLTPYLWKVTDSDIEIQPIDGTDRIKINNIPETTLSFYAVWIYMPDNTLIPMSIRNKWVTVELYNPEDTWSNAEFTISLYDGFETLLEYAGEVFSNLSSLTLTTKISLALSKVEGIYTSYIQSPYTVSHVNERSWYYKYLHAIMWFDYHGLPQPRSAGEDRNIDDLRVVNEQALDALNYYGAGVDPHQDYYTYFMAEWLRWRMPTATGVLSIGMNNASPDVSAAIHLLADARAKNIFMMERQIGLYGTAQKEALNLILAYCETNKIPVLSYGEMGRYLFDCKSSSVSSIIPAINICTTDRNRADGYEAITGVTWVSDDGGQPTYNNYYFKRLTAGALIDINDLGKISEGTNYLSGWFKGTIGTILKVTLSKKIYGTETYTRLHNQITYETESVYLSLLTNDWEDHTFLEFDRDEYCYLMSIDIESFSSCCVSQLSISKRGTVDSTTEQTALALTNKYKARVELDGGYVVDEDATYDLYLYLLNNNLLNCKIAWDSKAGVKTRIVNLDEFVEKVYDLGLTMNDISQTSENSQPKLVSGEFLFDGTDDYLNGTSLFAGTISYITCKNTANKRQSIIAGSFDSSMHFISATGGIGAGTSETVNKFNGVAVDLIITKTGSFIYAYNINGVNQTLTTSSSGRVTVGYRVGATEATVGTVTLYYKGYINRNIII
jgi:hypothetical protein